jgi:hypothetical protein
MKHFLALLFTLTLQHLTFGQTVVQKNEELIFSFTTNNGKKVVIAQNKIDKSVIYRFGTVKLTELEFHSSGSDKNNKMMYSFYLRGGGRTNEGMDLNYLYFTIKDVQYVVYDTYYSNGEKYNTGVKVIDLKTNKTTDIKGKINSKKGSLTDFRDNKLLDIGDELFD